MAMSKFVNKYKCWFLASVFLYTVGCATTRYQPPSADEIALKAERVRQEEIKNRAKKERYREWLRDTKTRHARLIDLAYPIRRAGVQLSEDEQVTIDFGFYSVGFESLEIYDEPYKREVVLEEDNIKNTNGYSKSVWHVASGSPAERAGMRAGDRIVAVHNESFVSSKDFWSKVQPDDEGKLSFVIKRDADNTYLTVKFAPERLSKYEIEYSDLDHFNAYADGEKMYIMKGLMDFVESDRELQYIIAHELAHNIERHVDKMLTNAALGGLFGLALDALIAGKAGIKAGGLRNAGAKIGVEAYSKNFEREADYLALYLLANAGIPIDGIADFWRKMSVFGLGYNKTHPSNPERFINLEAIEKEIRQKKTFGWVLVPNQ